jgi:large subunit ribosomal protein L25
MKLSAKERSSIKKGETKQIRREGKIPAILYSAGRSNVQLVLDSAEFSAILRNMKPGHLPTTTFTLMIDGKTQKTAVIKDIQYQLTTYQVSHIDFEELVEDVPISVKVPIQCIGVGDCVGIKSGGFLRQVIRYIKVECLPKHIPAEFVVDVKDLGIRQSRRLADIPMPEGVKPLAKMDEVVVVIAKRSA